MSDDANTNWRNDLDDEGFPTANEDRVGDIFTDEYGITYVVTLFYGLGYGWKAIDDPKDYSKPPD